MVPVVLLSMWGATAFVVADVETDSPFPPEALTR